MDKSGIDSCAVLLAGAFSQEVPSVMALSLKDLPFGCDLGNVSPERALVGPGTWLALVRPAGDLEGAGWLLLVHMTWSWIYCVPGWAGVPVWRPPENAAGKRISGLPTSRTQT
ncbi:hypothetical protein NDU88_001779 [Pleurodeles waltl]|uniref:Uncharacterized protein n=1 Tax=Pleurodeles waltl TaxID=8319 RepID=A0AAV7U7T5_PLEWA|nr:hypothetical protein NDU88_001779 [Pleurodeles waltl]